MSKGACLGYIVMNAGSACAIGDYGDGVKVLCVGAPNATVFATRRQAQRAISQSSAYATREGLGWDRKHAIVRLEAAEK